jgi:hypothetical protein
VDLATLLEFLSSGGVLVGSLIVIWLLVTERLVPKSRIADAQKERDEAQKKLADALARLEGMARQLEDVHRDLAELIRKR